VTGAKVDLSQLGSWQTLGALLVVTALAIVGKLVGCGLAARSLGRQSAMIVGVGMVPRGEVGIIVASLGMGAGVFTGEIYAIIISMSLLTSIIAPPLLSMLLKNAPPDAPGHGDEITPSPLLVAEETGHSARH
jgi:Kef-type K+ transport system membrane component KefB